MNITFVRQVNVIKVKLVKQPGICYHENVQLEKLFTKTALDENHRVNLNGAGNRPQEEYLFFFEEVKRRKREKTREECEIR